MKSRGVTIDLAEVENETTLGIEANEPVDFHLSFKPVKFPDPSVTRLETIVEAQRREIVKVVDELKAAKQALSDARSRKRR